MKQHAIVTGAASGIGAECCLDLASRGWVVHGIDVAEAGLQEVATRCSTKGKFIPWTCDISNSTSIHRVFAEISSITNQAHALICSAGIIRSGPLMSMSEQDFDDLFAINSKGAWLSSKAALPLLEQSAAVGSTARIIFVTSMAALRPKVGGGAYAASKAALGHLTRVLAVELAPKGILVNAVAPTTVDTPMVRKLHADAAHNGYVVSGASPLGRVAKPNEIVAVIRFLLSEDSGYINGAILPVDGGTSAAFRPPS